jgi:hypothetical protein
MTEPVFTTTNFFIQADKAAELMSKQDEELLALAAKINAEGHVLLSIHYG